MKKTLLLLVIGCVILLSGCATDGIYADGKAVYKGGKKVVKVLPLTPEARTALKGVDAVATGYDKIRTRVRGSHDENSTK